MGYERRPRLEPARPSRLTNVVIRAVLTTPGPFNLLHTEVPNRMMGTFPFLFIPGFLVPLAVVLHLLAIRALGSRLRPGKGLLPSSQSSTV
jgi:hypothetical protein